jgi:GYF domain 2
VIFHACRADGTKLGEFGEPDFQAKVFAGELTPADYYWHEGMPDWKPISEYRLLAKTQKISFAPPMRATVKIDMDHTASSQQPARKSNLVSRFLDRLRRRK